MRRTCVVRALILAVGLPVVLGCGERAALREMDAQRAEMTQDIEAWEAEVTGWKRDFEQMKQWHRATSRTSKGHETADKLVVHADRVEANVGEVAQFERELADHGRTLGERRRRPRDELARHAALWSEHLRLEVKYGALAGAQKELDRVHAELAGDAAARPN